MRHRSEKPEDSLINYGKAVKEKQNGLRIEKMKKETEGITF
jgi:hypothetical protein